MCTQTTITMGKLAGGVVCQLRSLQVHLSYSAWVTNGHQVASQRNQAEDRLVAFMEEWFAGGSMNDASSGTKTTSPTVEYAKKMMPQEDDEDRHLCAHATGRRLYAWEKT